MTEKAFTIRIEESLFEDLKMSAEKHKRSIAKEIEYILEEWQNFQKTDTGKQVEELKRILNTNIFGF